MKKSGFGSVAVLVILGILVIIGVAFYLYPRVIDQQKNLENTTGATLVTPTSTFHGTSVSSSTNSTIPSSMASTTVVAVFKPSCTFSISPTVILIPATANLSWSCVHTNKCSISSDRGDNFSNQNTSGTLSVSPRSASTTYILTCYAANNDIYSSTVTVTARSPSTEFYNP